MAVQTYVAIRAKLLLGTRDMPPNVSTNVLPTNWYAVP